MHDFQISAHAYQKYSWIYFSNPSLTELQINYSNCLITICVIYTSCCQVNFNLILCRMIIKWLYFAAFPKSLKVNLFNVKLHINYLDHNNYWKLKLQILPILFNYKLYLAKIVPILTDIIFLHKVKSPHWLPIVISE